MAGLKTACQNLASANGCIPDRFDMHLASAQHQIHVIQNDPGHGILLVVDRRMFRDV